jgi:hypothetical protein
MAEPRYDETAFQVPASEVPNDAPVAQRKFELVRQTGMIRISLGPTVQGQAGETYGVLLATADAQRIMNTLEVILARLER